MSRRWPGPVAADHGLSRTPQTRRPDVDNSVDNLTFPDHAGSDGATVAGACA